MGIKTVAVYSDVDSNNLHVRLADEAVCVGAAPTAKSYLCVQRILEAVKLTGAQAVHPGYGFLSENAEFASKLTEAGAVFIGPNSKAIFDMGDKIHSKIIAANAGLNVIPGHDDEIKDESDAIKAANEIGYPIIIKASAGGGGKGMRTARNDKECVKSYRLSKQEAASSFGDDRMLIEKFIDNPRHIEMQVLCDKHGNALWLNERECSIQRRNQKVIEEAPSSFVDSNMRRRMGEQAVELSHAVGYDSAGTVEFLVDSKKNFYFLEMNTRIQVEHSITEAITNIDIVQQMLRVAYGHKLRIKQSNVSINGWSFECRVYAEDPSKDFGTPSVGRLTKYEEPLQYPGIRCDSGAVEGSEISIYYDSLISKLISHGKDRNEALNRMSSALDHYVIHGVAHNIPLLRDIVNEKRFREGNITTKYLSEVYPKGFQGVILSESDKRAIVAVTAALKGYQAARARRYTNQHRRTITLTDPFSLVYSFVVQTSTEQGKKHFRVEVNFVDADPKKVNATVEGVPVSISGNLSLAQSVLKLNVDRKPLVTQIASKKPGEFVLIYQGSSFKLHVFPVKAVEYLQYMKEKHKVSLSTVMLSPMPGVIKSVNVEAGQMVSEGQELVVIEAMKMQNILHADKTGKIKVISCKPGTTVDKGDLLIELE